MKRDLLRKRNGQSMVELALTLPILLLILAGLLDFGWIYSNKLITSYCSREGARYGAVNSNSPGIAALVENRVKSAAPPFLSNSITVMTSFSNLSDLRSGDIIVNVTCRFSVLTPIASVFTGSSFYTVNSRCVMKVE
jgi:Flp pilus assembly protein TadG